MKNRATDNRFLLACGLIFVAASSRAFAEEPSLIRIDDLYRLDSPQGVVVAADGASAIYARRWSDRKERVVRHSLWRVEGDASHAKPLEAGEPDGRAPLLSPDGKWIVFLSTRPLPDGKPGFTPVPPYSDTATDIWLMPAAGGKAIPLAGRARPYNRVFSDPFFGNVAFSADGKRLVFVADEARDDRSPEEAANNVQIVRQDGGEGYEGYGPAQVWIADLLDEPGEVAASRVTRITSDDFWYGDPQWAEDGKAIIVHANRTQEQEAVRYSINQNYDLWRIDLGDGSLLQATFGPGPDVSPRVSPDGKRLLYLSIPRRGSHMDIFNLAVIVITEAGPQSQVLFNHHGPGEVPHLPPLFPLPRDCWLGPSAFHYTAATGVVTKPQVIDLAQGIAALEGTPETLSEESAKSAEVRRKLTPPADAFLKERIVAQGEVVTWKGADGLAVEGILTRPTQTGTKAPFKLALYPHGGPHSRSSLGFDFTVQVLAANGYAVFQPNFRGSGGYGQKFIDADRNDLGGQDMKDMLTGIDHLVKEGIVDANRQFVYGISYGGFSTCSLIGQTRQFRAAVPQNAVTDLGLMWGLSDIQSWTQWESGGRPWEVPLAIREHSPLTNAFRVKTPTLILHSANDRRCPLPMGKVYYQALKANGVETQMVIYPDEGHPIKQLPHQEDVLTRVLEWFGKHDAEEEGP
ncbi:MAG: S9 family peptidase [Pirellulaceae bacterium]